jgi:hypothetical protein
MTLTRKRTYLVVKQERIVARIEDDDGIDPPSHVVLVDDNYERQEYFDQTLEEVVDSLRQYYPGCIVYRAYLTLP